MPVKDLSLQDPPDLLLFKGYSLAMPMKDFHLCESADSTGNLNCLKLNIFPRNSKMMPKMWRTSDHRGPK